MIRRLNHKGLQLFFETGSKAGIQAAHAAKLGRLIAQLDVSESPQDMNVPGWRLHSSSGELKDHWAVWVNANWRMTFRFDGNDAEIVDYQDYH